MAGAMTFAGKRGKTSNQWHARRQPREKNVPVVSAEKVKSVDEESMSSAHKSMNLVENVAQN